MANMQRQRLRQFAPRKSLSKKLIVSAGAELPECVWIVGCGAADECEAKEWVGTLAIQSAENAFRGVAGGGLTGASIGGEGTTGSRRSGVDFG